MTKKIFRAFMALGALATACASWGCVADRPARNGVFNENQYLRKDFLVRPATAGATDPGWFLKATIVGNSTPNPLAVFNITDGSDNSGGENYVRFVVTEDKLDMVSMRELSPGNAAQGARDSDVVNAWPITNVDLKYRVNLDGETSNFYEENQELDWQVRQWVKVNLDKNDLSDLAPLGSSFQTFLTSCADGANSSTTLVPNSFVVDETNNYMSWQVQISVPVLFTQSSCTDAYGSTGILFQEFGRQNATFTLMYSMVRAAPDSGFWRADGSASTYVPMAIAEKDPIQKKYGPIANIEWNRDPSTGLLAAQNYVYRHNPNEPLFYYFAQGYPQAETVMFTRPGGIMDQTNQIFADAGAKTRITFLNYDDLTTFNDHANPNPKQFGDVRYNMIRWISDLDIGAAMGGVLAETLPYFDPRTGEAISVNIDMYDFDIYNYVVTRLDFYLQTIGAEEQLNAQGEWPTIPAGYSAQCTVGQTVPFGGLDFSTGGVVQTQHNETSTVFDKMQLYMHKPSTTYGYLSPSDFIPQENADFESALYKILPYEVFRDPGTNPYVIPEGGKGSYAPADEMAAYSQRAQFHALTAQIDHGASPYSSNAALGYTAPSVTSDGSAVQFDGQGGMNDFASAEAFTDNLMTLTTGFRNQQYLQTLRPIARTQDGATGILTNFEVFSRDARQCISNDPLGDPLGKKGQTHWETRDEYITSLVETYHILTLWHEFGHSLGLDHNFMGSVDKVNFPTWTDVTGKTRFGMYTSSIMEYNNSPDRVFWTGGVSAATNAANTDGPWGPNGAYNGIPGWGPYDIGALSWIYGNNQDAKTAGPHGDQNLAAVSGQDTATSPWNDPHGFNGKNEIQFLYCSGNDAKFSPFCRTFDFGSTPSEIIASDIDNYEFNYKWRNFRLYNKFWDDGPYADGVAGTLYEMRRFLSTWAYDWSDGELIENFPKVGVLPPANVPLINYYSDLAQAFTNDISVANQLVAAFHKAIIQQSSGERPFVTIYDPFYGDVVQQGIILDKVFALQSWTSLYEVDNYDPTQSAGAYMFAATPFDVNYQSVAEDTLDSMIGGEYDAFAYVPELGVQLFAKASHDINFTGRTEMRDWVGGKAFGGPGIDPNEEFLNFVHQMAQSVNASSIDSNIFAGCTAEAPLNACVWDPRIAQVDANDEYHSDAYNEFRGPDGRRYAWSLIADRNQIVLVDRDRNTAAYITVRNYNQDVIASQDDGTAGAYSYELPIKYTIDAFNQYN